jgi:hypothetical protein
MQSVDSVATFHSAASTSFSLSPPSIFHDDGDMAGNTLVNTADDQLGRSNSAFEALMAFAQSNRSYREVEAAEEMAAKGYFASTQKQYEAREQQYAVQMRFLEMARTNMDWQ